MVSGNPIGNLPVAIPEDQLAAFCQRWNISELALFGSVLREDFRPDSDIDVLAVFDSPPTLADYLQMEEELTRLFGRKVDLVERQLVEESDNYIRRRHILNSAQVIYGAG